MKRGRCAKIGKTLRPTELLIFGNPQGGTPFMECQQSRGIDLPLKALVWEDASAQVWLGYNDPGFLAQRHGASACPVVENLRKALTGWWRRASAARASLPPKTRGSASRPRVCSLALASTEGSYLLRRQAFQRLTSCQPNQER